MDNLEFFARVAFHIPDKGQVMVRYYGFYSNAHRGKVRESGTDPSYPPIIKDEPNYVPSKARAVMIRKVCQVYPLLCPNCGGQMSLISFIKEPKVIDRIIAHLKLTFEAEAHLRLILSIRNSSWQLRRGGSISEGPGAVFYRF